MVGLLITCAKEINKAKKLHSILWLSLVVVIAIIFAQSFARYITPNIQPFEYIYDCTVGEIDENPDSRQLGLRCQKPEIRFDNTGKAIGEALNRSERMGEFSKAAPSIRFNIKLINESAGSIGSTNPDRVDNTDEIVCEDGRRFPRNSPVVDRGGLKLSDLEAELKSVTSMLDKCMFKIPPNFIHEMEIAPEASLFWNFTERYVPHIEIDAFSWLIIYFGSLVAIMAGLRLLKEIVIFAQVGLGYFKKDQIV